VETWDRFKCVTFLFVMALGMEGGSFFMIHALQIPKTHWFNVMRLTIMSLLAMVVSSPCNMYSEFRYNW
jgi:hypothetical protein